MTRDGKNKFNRGCFKRPGSTAWEFFYTSEHGKRTSMKGFASLEETLKLRQRTRDQVRQKQLGVYDADAVAFTAGQSQHIDELITQFGKTKDTIQITAAHRDKVMGNIRDCVAQTGAKRAGELTKDSIAVAVEQIRKDRNWSYESANQMIAAMRSFCLWMHENGTTKKNVAKAVKKYNEKVDRHHDRRELTDGEITALFAAAMASKRHRNGGPVERYLLCRTALETGFRKEEFRPLNKSRFELNGDGPGVMLVAGEDKAKRGAKQPISKELAGLLGEYFATVTDRLNILRVPFKTDQMMRRLCKRAKVAYKKDGRFADFHSWRHTFITRLANSTNPPISLWIVKELARHASITTTEKYVHRRPDDERRAIELHGDRCAALALAQDGQVRVMLVRNGIVDVRESGGVENVRNGPKPAKPRQKRGMVRHCVGRESNPQPSASEADALSN